MTTNKESVVPVSTSRVDHSGIGTTPDSDSRTDTSQETSVSHYITHRNMYFCIEQNRVGSLQQTQIMQSPLKGNEFGKQLT